MKLKDKKVLVFGTGKSGAAAAGLLLKHHAKVILFDGNEKADVKSVLDKLQNPADVKVYLTASAACRAKRRYDELAAKGEACDLKAIEADIIERDERDMNREFAPLKRAEDAVFVDSSEMTIEEVTAKIISLAE